MGEGWAGTSQVPFWSRSPWCLFTTYGGYFVMITVGLSPNPTPIATPQMPLGKLRDLMPALAHKTYFNYGGQGPLPSLEKIIASWRTIRVGTVHLGGVALCRGPGGCRSSSVGGGLWGGTHRIALSENVTSSCVLGNTQYVNPCRLE